MSHPSRDTLTAAISTAARAIDNAAFVAAHLDAPLEHRKRLASSLSLTRALIRQLGGYPSEATMELIHEGLMDICATLES